MTEAHTAISQQTDSRAAGHELGQAMRNAFNGAAPDAVVVFASAQHDYHDLLGALADAAGTDVIAGASAAGEFIQGSRGEGRVSAIALRSDSMQFSVGLGTGVAGDVRAAASQVLRGFEGLKNHSLPHRSALVMTDALAGHTDPLVEELTLKTAGNYRFFGGGAGDDGRFSTTHVFAGRQAHTDAVVALEILSERPVGVGVAHGWEPAGAGMRVTESEGNRLVSLNRAPAVHAFQEYAELSGQRLDLKQPLPFLRMARSRGRRASSAGSTTARLSCACCLNEGARGGQPAAAAGASGRSQGGGAVAGAFARRRRAAAVRAGPGARRDAACTRHAQDGGRRAALARVPNDGPGALESAACFDPHLVLLDIGLPGMDGYETAARLRELPGMRARLVALTGYGSAQDRERALKAGFDEHLVKPLPPEAMEALLKGLRAMHPVS